MEMTEVMRTTAAVREFTDEPVGDSDLYSVLEAARFAPSGGNRQPWKVVVAKDPALRHKIAELYGLAWREYWAHVERHLVPFAAPEVGQYKGPAIDLEAARRKPAPDTFGAGLAHVPVMLLLFCQLGALAVTDNGLGRQSIVGGASVYPFGHNILLAARDKGLGGVMTTVLCREEPRVRDLVGCPPGWALAGMLALGRPARQVTRLRRQAVEDLAVIDRFDGAPFTAE